MQEAQQTLSRINTKKTRLSTPQSKCRTAKAKTPRDTWGQGGDGEADIYTTAAGRQANQRAGKEKPEFYSQHKDPLKLKENEDSSDKPKLGESVTNRQETLKKC